MKYGCISIHAIKSLRIKPKAAMVMLELILLMDETGYVTTTIDEIKNNTGLKRKEIMQLLYYLNIVKAITGAYADMDSYISFRIYPEYYIPG